MKELLRDAILLKTNLSWVVYLGSTEKYPCLNIWYLSNPLLPLALSSINPSQILREFSFIFLRKSESLLPSKIRGSNNLNWAGIEEEESTKCIVPLTFLPEKPLPLLVSGS